jgi:hypothetical protein
MHLMKDNNDTDRKHLGQAKAPKADSPAPAELVGASGNADGEAIVTGTSGHAIAATGQTDGRADVAGVGGATAGAVGRADGRAAALGEPQLVLKGPAIEIWKTPQQHIGRDQPAAAGPDEISVNAAGLLMTGRSRAGGGDMLAGPNTVLPVTVRIEQSLIGRFRETVAKLRKLPSKIGRPSSKKPVQEEAERRIEHEIGNIPDQVGLWGDNFSAWLAEKHPEKPQASGKVCAGYVRKLHRKAMAKKVLKSTT